MDPEYFKSKFPLGLIEDTDNYEDLLDASLRKWLELNAKEEMDTVTTKDIEKIMEQTLSIKMSDSSAKSRI